MILMATLGPRASAVIDAARSALRATEADRERIDAALRVRLGPSVLPVKLAVPHASHFRPSARRFAWRVIPPAVGVFVLGGALSFAIHPSAGSSVEQKVSAAVTAPYVAAAPSTEGTEQRVPVIEQPVASIVAAPKSSPRPVQASLSLVPTQRKQDQLVLEVALLSRATTALSSGRAGDALKALNEHQRDFPNGLLSMERRAARGQALCLLGRVAEGRAELANLASQPLAANRVKLVCDAAETSTEAKSND